MLEILVRISFPAAIYASSALPGLRAFKRLNRSLEAGVDFVVIVARSGDTAHQVSVLSMHVRQQRVLKVADLVSTSISFKVAFVGSKEHQPHLGNALRRVLLLLHQLGDALTMIQLSPEWRRRDPRRTEKKRRARDTAPRPYEYRRTAF